MSKIKTNRSGNCWRPTFWLADGRFLTVSSRGGERAVISLMSLLKRALIPFMRVPSQRPHLQILSHWGFRLQHLLFRGHTHSFYSKDQMAYEIFDKIISKDILGRVLFQRICLLPSSAWNIIIHIYIYIYPKILFISLWFI